MSARGPVTETFVQEWSKDPAARAGYASARLQIHVSDLLNSALESSGVPKSELARRLGITRARMSQILNGVPQNFTLDLVGRAAGALDLLWEVKLVDYYSQEDRHGFASTPIGHAPMTFLPGYISAGKPDDSAVTPAPLERNAPPVGMRTWSKPRSLSIAPLAEEMG
jgi:transcriptional regulator with XRE-family HTH domain